MVTERVLSLDGKGDVARAELTVERMSLNGKSVYDAGTVIIAERTRFSVRSYEVPSAVSSVLQCVARSQLMGLLARDYDALVGSDKARNIGETWPVDQAAISALARSSEYDLKPENITGSVQLSATDDKSGEAELRATATATKVGGVLAGMKILDGNLSTRFAYTLAQRPQRAEPLSWSVPREEAMKGGGQRIGCILSPLHVPRRAHRAASILPPRSVQTIVKQKAITTR